ncbi:Protein of uncharacterised function (DUF1602) [Bordetella pertussis]|nr:Protein of uncharacterised function (DUF1602) [Bordetella pertussis]
MLGAPICCTTPWSSTAMRSAVVMASSWSWVTKMVVMPSRRCSDSRSWRICTRSFLSRLDRGSSSSSTCGSMTMVRASATRCCWPPDSWLGRRRPKSARPTSSSAAATLSRISARGRRRSTRPKATLSHTVMCGHSA